MLSIFLFLHVFELISAIAGSVRYKIYIFFIFLLDLEHINALNFINDECENTIHLIRKKEPNYLSDFLDLRL